jgi:hypothetical protein
MASFINTVIDRNAVILGQQSGPKVWKSLREEKWEVALLKWQQGQCERVWLSYDFSY